jgi:hypothetical protein
MRPIKEAVTEPDRAADFAEPVATR